MTSIQKSAPWLMLLSRPVLFLLSQVLIALVLILLGVRSAWDESARWWTFVAVFANVGSFFLLLRLYKAEGGNYLDTLRFSRQTWRFVIVPQADGTSRLITRTRTMMVGGLWTVIHPGVFIMERGMLLGIKERAEGAN